MPKSSLQIRDYENIRSILRDVYIFGCFSRDDFIERGISGRKYDAEQKRINAYLPEGFLKNRRVGKKVQYYCSYGLNAENNSPSGENSLAETYRNKSFTMLDITSYFWVLEILNEKQGCSLQEILDNIPQVNDDILYTKDNLRVKLNELEARGFIRTEKIAGRVSYFLVEDIWAGFSTEELENIYLFLDYVQNTMPLEMPYIFLMRKLRLYLFGRGVKKFPEGVLQFKHNHLFNVLDNEIMLSILYAIADRSSVLIRRTGAEALLTVIPVRVIHDCTYGRQYLLCTDISEDKSPMMIRLDRIEAVLPGKSLSEDEILAAENAVRDEEECWCTSGLREEPHNVDIEVRFDEEKEPYILRRLYREGHGGTVRKIGNGRYRYSVSVRDPLEMLPWIRSFGEHMVVTDDGGTGLSKRVSEDWRKAVENYVTLESSGSI